MSDEMEMARSQYVTDLIREAVKAEREACAKIAEEFPVDILQMWERPGGPPGNGWRSTTFKDVAEAIRARSNQHAQHKPSDVSEAVNS